MQPGIQPNGLFWTAQIHRRNFQMNRAGTKARLKVRNMPLSDSITFGGNAGLSASADITVDWETTGDPVQRGSGTNAASPEDQDAFLGMIADARCTARATAFRTGFSFRTNTLTSDGYYASLGTEQNGAFL